MAFPHLSPQQWGAEDPCGALPTSGCAFSCSSILPQGVAQLSFPLVLL